MSQQGYLSNEGHQVTREEKKVLAGTLVGTTIEWYDFFIYAQAAGFVLAVLYFEPLGEESETLAQLVAWASVGISFLFRPLGAILAGWIGDRFGRKVVLVITLMGMGGATFLVGVLPTHATWGMAAPLLLIVLRVIQGLSAGGEWGGAALLSVEHAPRHKRGLFGMYPQIGVPLGMILATLFMFGLNAFLTEEQFLQWGWRVPFIFSFVLIVAAYLIRRRVEESPVFTEMKERKKESSAPLKELVTTHKKYTFLAALIFAANNAAGYLVIAFFAAYGASSLGMSRTETLTASLIGGVGWFIFTVFGGWISDRIGRVLTFQIGYGIIIVWAIPMWFLIDTGVVWIFTLAIVVLTMGLGPSYGPQSALYAEMFPVSIRFSGVSIGYAFGSIIGGAFAPMIAQAILDGTGQSWMIGLYISGLAIISFLAVSVVPKKLQGINLQDDSEREEFKMAPKLKAD
ncbi:MFS transporter [Garicola koreensis]|uniref:MFS family permease n=1 Tax=Garicola koreensis TaxID=1262554 RepID=A0A7W5TUN1_9MICC|nr:MFS transporter [Garicola koreensis]MBB3667888.1 MFS family permease [Garicola koreensis]